MSAAKLKASSLFVKWNELVIFNLYQRNIAVPAQKDSIIMFLDQKHLL